MVRRAGTGFGVYHSGSPESNFRLREPSGVFTTSEMSAIFVALIQIRARRPTLRIFFRVINDFAH
jgi:hypothetical protein